MHHSTEIYSNVWWLCVWVCVWCCHHCCCFSFLNHNSIRTFRYFWGGEWSQPTVVRDHSWQARGTVLMLEIEPGLAKCKISTFTTALYYQPQGLLQLECTSGKGNYISVHILCMNEYVFAVFQHFSNSLPSSWPCPCSVCVHREIFMIIVIMSSCPPPFFLSPHTFPQPFLFSLDRGYPRFPLGVMVSLAGMPGQDCVCRYQNDTPQC